MDIFHTRDSIICYSAYATALPSVRPSVPVSVCLSHTCIVSKRLNVSSKFFHEILSRSDRPMILVFRHQGLLRKSDGFTPNGAPNTRHINMQPYLGNGNR